MTKEQKLDMFSMHLDGITYEEIGKKYGISKQAVYRIIHPVKRTRKIKAEQWAYPNVAAFWRKHDMAHPVQRKYKRTRNGREYVYHQTEWIADVCAHQFRHEYVCMLCMAEVPEEIAIQLVGHANAKMIHEVYLTLKPQMIKSAGSQLDLLLSGNSEF